MPAGHLDDDTAGRTDKGIEGDEWPDHKAAYNKSNSKQHLQHQNDVSAGTGLHQEVEHHQHAAQALTSFHVAAFVLL